MESYRLRPSLVWMLAALLASSCTVQRSTDMDPGDAEAFNARAYAGTELHILVNDHPWVHHITPRIQEFLDLDRKSTRLNSSH